MRSLARLALALGCAVAQLECGESGRYGVTSSGSGPSTPGNPTPPTSSGIATVSILSPAKVPGNTPVNVGDSVLIQFRASSARKVKEVDLFGVALRGDVTLGTDTVQPRFFSKVVPIAFKTDTIMRRYLFAIPGDSTAETVFIIATVVDSAGNTGADTVTIHVAPGPHVVLTSPANNAQVSTGKSVTVSIHVTSALGTRVVGWRATGVAPVVFSKNDSTIYAATALPKDTIRTDTLTIPAATASGIIVLTPFAVDSAGNPSGGAIPDTIHVQSAASDVTPPLVQFTVLKRVEVDDSITIHATDPSGIKNIGFIVRGLGVATVWAGDSNAFSGNQTDITVTLPLGRPAPAPNRGLDTVSAFPRLLTIEAFAVDSVGNRGLSSFTNSPIGAAGTAASDTLTIVAGKTFALPAGGSIGDAIYNRNRNELYLSNQSLNRLEVFDVSTSSFLAGGIPVGSRPLGIALWPRDTLGNYADTVIVANTGGTNLSIVDVAARVERRRHRLASYEVQLVSVVPDSIGIVELIATTLDYSDRPFAVGAVCITSGAATCAYVRAVYSTTPTAAQLLSNRGYIAWSDLNPPADGKPHNHFVYEHVSFQASIIRLQIIAVFDSVPGQPLRDTVLGAGINVRPPNPESFFPDLVFRDSTFVRNSGDFQHALFGEGGDAGFARAISYDARQKLGTLSGSGCTVFGVTLNCTGTFDSAVTDAIYVSDFVVNRASRIHSIAMNFNGRTNFVRADSIYVTDFTLRQQGMIQVGGQNAGMDVNPSNTFDASCRGTGGFCNTLNANNRLLYAARPDANIEVFDTYFYGTVALIPVRDPIIGPIRLALNNAGQQVLVGVTANGVVVVPFTAPTNPFPVRAGVRAGSH